MLYTCTVGWSRARSQRLVRDLCHFHFDSKLLCRNLAAPEISKLTRPWSKYMPTAEPKSLGNLGSVLAVISILKRPWKDATCFVSPTEEGKLTPRSKILLCHTQMEADCVIPLCSRLLIPRIDFLYLLPILFRVQQKVKKKFCAMNDGPQLGRQR